jgi:predicted RNA-binding Zn ribbon-like protein
MRVTSQQPSEWVDGFLFVGNLLVLDFLNTKPILKGEPTELLPDTASLERWLVASGIVTSAQARALVRRWRDAPRAKAFLEKLLAFRERLRAAVVRQQRGLSISNAMVSEINLLLQENPSQITLRWKTKKLERVAVFEPQEPDDVWAPIAAAAAELLSDIPTSRIRKCESESCVIWFYDTSKKGSRRWCSMNICGNRLKVAAYRHRNRAAGVES